MARLHSDSERRAWTIVTLGIVSAAILLRFILNFATPYPPGVDAGYYPMQTLYWFAHRRLMYVDLPLLFWLNIALTKLLNVLGQPLDAAALLASRILDSVLQPFTAVVFMIAGHAWSEGRRKGIAVSGIAALIATASPSVLSFLSDFQKNSLGLVWMAAAIWTCRSVMAAPTKRRWVALAIFLMLSALTHIGAFAVTVLAVGLPLLIWCWKQRDRSLLLMFGIAVLILTVLLAVFDSRRALALAVSPFSVFLEGGIQFPVVRDIIGSLVIVVLAIRRCRLDRDKIPSSDAALITGLAATLVFLVLPKNAAYFGRLLLMVPIPAVFLILFVLARRAAAGRSSLPALVVLGLAAVPIVPQPFLVGAPFMNEPMAAELTPFKQQIARLATDPRKILIVAPHGLEWWAGFFLGTPVAEMKPATLDTRYERLLLLRSTPAFRFPGSTGPISLHPLDPSARRIYQGKFIEVYEVLQGRVTTTDLWTGTIELAPDKPLTFRAELDPLAVPPFGYLVVGDERMAVPEISLNGNSMLLNFSEYGAEMRGTLDGKTWRGEYLRHRGKETKSFKFSATLSTASQSASNSFLPPETLMPLGVFRVKFEDEKESQAVTSAKFWKKDNAVFGTFIAPDGDYGLLEGAAAGNGQAEFHRFTGWQATRIDLRHTAKGWTGSFLAASEDKPRAFVLEAGAGITARVARMKKPETAFEFSCTSPTGQTVRNTDADFKGKATIVDIMGTWCHNCLDEAPVLQQLKRTLGKVGLQVVGLSFEITDDAKLAEKNLSLFKNRFDLTYPLLFCGDMGEANIDQRLKSQIDNFFAFPTVLFIDPAGRVQAIHSGFKGPGTGDEFASEVTELQKLALSILRGRG